MSLRGCFLTHSTGSRQRNPLDPPLGKRKHLRKVFKQLHMLKHWLITASVKSLLQRLKSLRNLRFLILSLKISFTISHHSMHFLVRRRHAQSASVAQYKYLGMCGHAAGVLGLDLLKFESLYLRRAIYQLNSSACTSDGEMHRIKQITWG